MDSSSFTPAGGPAFVVALIDDDPDSVFLLKRQLIRVFPRASIAVFSSRDVASGLSSPAPDVFLVAYRLLGVSGLNVLPVLREQFPGVPLMLMSEVALRADEAAIARADRCLIYDENDALRAELLAVARSRRPRSSQAATRPRRHVA